MGPWVRIRIAWPIVALALAIPAWAAGHEHRHAAAGETSSVYRMPPFGQALVDHLHNKIVHFPVALALVGALLLWLARRKPELKPGALWVIWIAALSGIAAYFTGQAQHEAFEDKPKEWLMEFHRNLGTASAIALLVWALLCSWKRVQGRAWIWGLLLALLMLVTSFYGGLLAHGGD